MGDDDVKSVMALALEGVLFVSLILGIGYGLGILHNMRIVVIQMMLIMVMLGGMPDPPTPSTPSTTYCHLQMNWRRSCISVKDNGMRRHHHGTRHGAAGSLALRIADMMMMICRMMMLMMMLM